MRAVYDPYDEYDERLDRPATEAEAHAEWHRNAGLPMDQPGCPWDCCDAPYDEEDDMANATKHKPEPGKVVVVSEIPDCAFCSAGTPGPYDFRMSGGSWANGCEYHWKRHRASNELGVGHGQLWITADQVAS